MQTIATHRIVQRPVAWFVGPVLRLASKRRRGIPLLRTSDPVIAVAHALRGARLDPAMHRQLARMLTVTVRLWSRT